MTPRFDVGERIRFLHEDRLYGGVILRIEGDTIPVYVVRLTEPRYPLNTEFPVLDTLPIYLPEIHTELNGFEYMLSIKPKGQDRFLAGRMSSMIRAMRIRSERQPHLRHYPAYAASDFFPEAQGDLFMQLNLTQLEVDIKAWMRNELRGSDAFWEAGSRKTRLDSTRLAEYCLHFSNIPMQKDWQDLVSDWAGEVCEQVEARLAGLQRHTA